MYCQNADLAVRKTQEDGMSAKSRSSSKLQTPYSLIKCSVKSQNARGIDAHQCWDKHRCTKHRLCWRPVSTFSEAHKQAYWKIRERATWAEMETEAKVLYTLARIMAEQLSLTLFSPLETTIPILLFLWVIRTHKESFQIHASQLSPI